VDGRDGVGVDGLFWIGWRVGCWNMYRVCRFGREFGKVLKPVSKSGVAECKVGVELRILVGKL
jgi:hypothetical protein